MSETTIGLGSGNLDLLEILLRGPDAWNQWRGENPYAHVDLSNVNLRGAHLRGVNLIGADLSFAD